MADFNYVISYFFGTGKCTEVLQVIRDIFSNLLPDGRAFCFPRYEDGG